MTDWQRDMFGNGGGGGGGPSCEICGRSVSHARARAVGFCESCAIPDGDDADSVEVTRYEVREAFQRAVAGKWDHPAEVLQELADKIEREVAERDERDPAEQRRRAIRQARQMLTELPPWVKGSPTSREASMRLRDAAPSYRVAILLFILARGDRGATDEEIEKRMGMIHQTVSSCTSTLKRIGLIEETGETRTNDTDFEAAVQVASDTAEEALRYAGGAPR